MFFYCFVIVVVVVANQRTVFCPRSTKNKVLLHEHKIEIQCEFSRKNMIASHVKITLKLSPLLWFQIKPNKEIFGISLVFI